MSNPAKWVLIALVVVVWFASGHLDHADAQAQHEYQCEMIRDGHWPASVNRHCGED